MGSCNEKLSYKYVTTSKKGIFMKRKTIRQFICAIITVSIAIGMMAPALLGVQAVAASGQDSSKTDFNYVALGASNVNGYGVHGYNFDRVYEAPFEKEFDNRYGYKMNTPEAYPVLIKNKLSEQYDNVNLSLIAMSSMRIEEVRVLLDENYWGDSYTDKWFYDTNGDGSSSNWSQGAALYEWQKRAEAGVPGYDHEPTREEAFATLRDATVVAVSEADLITIDVGMNNFGTYMLNFLSDGIYSSDLSQITPEIGELYNTIRDYLLEAIKSKLSDQIPEEMIRHFANTLSYAVVGYCYNMDAVMKIIGELNPDADIVVTSIQNMMSGLKVVYPGFDGEIPFGELFEIMVGVANFYVSVLSPYADRYYYANLNADSHVEFLLDEMAAYNGNPSTLSENIRDCFDVYDGTMYLKTRIQQRFAIMMSESNFVNIDASQADKDSLDSLKAFHYGFHYDVDRNNTPVVTIADGTPLKDFIKMGEEGKLEGDYKVKYELYSQMLSLGYDVIAEIMREASITDTIDLPGYFAASKAGISAVKIALNAFDSVYEDALANQNYSFDIYEAYPDGFFNTMAAIYNATVGENGMKLEEGALDALFCFGMRMSFAGTAFCHPNANGYKEVFDIVWSAYTKKTTGRDIIIDQMAIYYKPDNDSYYVAIGNGENGYAELYADMLSLSDERFNVMSWDSIEYDEIDKADLVSVGFSEGEILASSIDNMLAFIGEYISTDARDAFAAYLSSIIDGAPILSAMGLDEIALTKVNEKIDEILASDMFAGKTMAEFDWASIVGEENLPMVDAVRTEIKNAVVNFVGSETYTFEIDVVGLIAQAVPLLDADLIYALLGDKAIFAIDIPVVDGLLYALESYVYAYVCQMKQCNTLISYINTHNPDAKIVMFGQYNPANGMCLEIKGTEYNIGKLYDVITNATSVVSLVSCVTSSNSTFVYIPEVKSVYSEAVSNGELNADILTFIEYCTTNDNAFEMSSAYDQYVAERMSAYVLQTCENHHYSNKCDTDCNRCGAMRTVPHQYSTCDDIDCNLCLATRDPIAHTLDGCEDAECNLCGEPVVAKTHQFGEWIVIRGATEDAEGEECRKCTNCDHTETRSIPVLVPDNGISGALIAVLIVGGVMVLGAAGFCVYWFVIRKKTKKGNEEI